MRRTIQACVLAGMTMTGGFAPAFAQGTPSGEPETTALEPMPGVERRRLPTPEEEAPPLPSFLEAPTPEEEALARRILERAERLREEAAAKAALEGAGDLDLAAREAALAAREAALAAREAAATAQQDGTPPREAQEAAAPRAQEEANLRLVTEFYNRFFNQHDLAAVGDFVGQNYIQHNPHVPNGSQALVNFFIGHFAENPGARSEIKRSAAAGDLVWLHVHARQTPEDLGRAVVDIFRVENGRIVEHWDVIQPVPEGEPPNGNTMF